jgi:hypothetical protein
MQTCCILPQNVRQWERNLSAHQGQKVQSQQWCRLHNYCEIIGLPTGDGGMNFIHISADQDGVSICTAYGSNKLEVFFE